MVKQKEDNEYEVEYLNSHRIGQKNGKVSHRNEGLLFKKNNGQLNLSYFFLLNRSDWNTRSNGEATLAMKIRGNLVIQCKF